MRGLPIAHFLAGSCQTHRASHRHSSQMFCSKLFMNLMLSTSLPHSGAVCPGFLLADSSPPVFSGYYLCYFLYSLAFFIVSSSSPPHAHYTSLFSFSQHYSHHLPVLPLCSKQDVFASSWPFVLLNLWNIFLPNCHLCFSTVCCLILASIFMLLLLLHIFTHFHKSPTVSGCPAWCKPLQLTQFHFCVGLSSSPSCCLLICLRKSSWKIRFLFSCSVHFKLSLHAPIHHM